MQKAWQGSGVPEPSRGKVLVSGCLGWLLRRESFTHVCVFVAFSNEVLTHIVLFEVIWGFFF